MSGQLVDTISAVLCVTTFVSPYVVEDGQHEHLVLVAHAQCMMHDALRSSQCQPVGNGVELHSEIVHGAAVDDAMLYDEKVHGALRIGA